MQIGLSVTTEPLTRQEALRRWMRLTGVTFRALAEGSGVSGTQMGNLAGQETMPTCHHRHLVAQGVPSELLPRAEDQKRGRKRIVRPITHEAAMAAFRGA